MFTIKVNISQKTRHVSDLGETLIIREYFGYKALVDPNNPDVLVYVPSGRYATLVRYNFPGLPGRDAHVLVFRNQAGLGFAHVLRPHYRVSLKESNLGQLVEIMATSEPVIQSAALAAKPRRAVKAA